MMLEMWNYASGNCITFCHSVDTLMASIIGELCNYEIAKHHINMLLVNQKYVTRFDIWQNHLMPFTKHHIFV